MAVKSTSIKNFVFVLFLTISLIAPSTPAVAQGESQGVTIYLPYTSNPPTVTPLEFASAPECTGDFGDFQKSPSVYNHGLKRLGVTSTIVTTKPVAWRMEWTIGGTRQPGLDDQGTVEPPFGNASFSLVFGTGGCRSALPRNTYAVELFIDGVSHQTATATIQ